MQLFCLTAAVVLAVAFGSNPTQTRWGADGISAMYASAAICLIASVIGALPLPIVARKAPSYVGQAAFAGTALRLLLTGAMAGIYQSSTAVHLRSFLTWLASLYLLLLVIDTIFGVIIVRRNYADTRGS